MAIIYTYPTKATPLGADLVLISDSADGKKSKNATIASLVTSNAIDVVDTLNSLKGDINITGGTNITVTPSGQNIQISTSASNVDGSGTAGKIPKWSDSNTLTDSIISESASKIGIGTTSPDGLLHVSAGTEGDARLILEADTDNNDENDVPQIWFKADGDVTEGLIGLNDNFLDIVSNTSEQHGIRFFTGSTSNSGTTDPYTDATEKMRITPSGNLGIGIIAPTEKLDVVGNIKTSGSLSLSKGSNTLKISTPATITTSYELVMPAAVGTASQVLKLPSPIGATPYQLAWDDANPSGVTSTLLGGTGVEIATATSYNILVGSGSTGTDSAFTLSGGYGAAIQLPADVTARRPAANAANVGLIRYNTTLAKFEGVQEITPGSSTYAWFQLTSTQ